MAAEIWLRPTADYLGQPSGPSLREQHEYAEGIRKDIEALCRPDGYNVVLHKHLGDNFYIVGAKTALENTYGKPVRFIVNPQHEFLMKLWGVDDYAVYDIGRLIRKNKPFLASFYGKRYPNRFEVDGLDTTFCQALFDCTPRLGQPCITDNVFNVFVEYPYYWCFRWVASLGVEKEFRFELPPHGLALSKTAQSAVDKLGGLDKIILLLPEAATATELPPEWWQKIADALRSKGYVILVNSKRIQLKGTVSAFDFDLSLEDVAAVGLQCHAVFALRSGLTDVLVGAGERLHVITPACLRREVGGLQKPFRQKTNVRELWLYRWQVHPASLVFEGIDLAELLRPEVEALEKSYWRALIKSAFNRKHRFWYCVFRDIAGVSRRYPDNNEMNPLPSTRSTRFFGVEVYRKTSYEKNNEHLVERQWLKGLASSVRKEASFKCKLLGIPVFERKDRVNRVYRLFGITVWRKPRRAAFFRYLEAHISAASEEVYGKNASADHVFIIRHNIGETVLYLAGLRKWIERVGAKRPIVIVWRKRDLALFKLFLGFAPFVRFVPIAQSDINHFLSKPLTTLRSSIVHAPTYELAETMRDKLSCGENVNFCDLIRQSMDLSEWTGAAYPAPDERACNHVEWLLSQEEVRKPYVLLCPEATSTKTLPDWFWQSLADHFLENGFDVVVNSYYKPEHERLKGCVYCAPHIDILFALAQQADRIVSIASGLSILLTLAKKPIDIIYTDFCNRKLGFSPSIARKTYSVKHLPFDWSQTAVEHLAGEDLDALLLSVTRRADVGKL